MPTIPAPNYSPPFFLQNKHLVTIFPTLLRPHPKVIYHRERIDTPDGDFLDLDWVEKGNEKLVIVLHGLEGSSDSKYVKGIMKHFSSQGWDGLAINFRSCSGEPNHLARSYHSGETEDLRFIVNQTIAKGIYSDIALIGFSLGGNVLLKYLGEQGEKVHKEISAAVAISVPCDLASSAKVLSKPSNWIYMQRFMRKLRKKVIAKKALIPNWEAVLRMHNFAQFDEAFTAPIHGFNSSNDYWEKCSSRPFISHIKTPTLLINALDDPFLSQACFPFSEAKENPYFWLETPEKGGHVGFVGFGNKNTYYSEKRALDFVLEIQKRAI